MIAMPSNLADIELLIRNGVKESIHLDYKASAALDPIKRDEIAKDVSAFANSDGGLLIYGVAEDPKSHLPKQIDDGVNPKWNRDWFEQVVASNISPRIDGIEIAEFTLNSNGLVLCVRVPKSFRGPHQAPDHRYYKRFNFSSFPMEHYEVDDVRGRSEIMPALIVLDLKVPSENFLPFVLRNIGKLPARNLTFSYPKDMKWPDKTPPSQFTRGVAFLPPGKELVIYCSGNNKIFDWKDTGSVFEFDIEVSYQPGSSTQKVVDVFHFDVADYRNTALYTGTEKVEHDLDDIARSLRELVSLLQNLSWRGQSSPFRRE